MPQLETRQFGLLDYLPEAVLEFPAGIPAFEHERRFLPIEQAATRPFVFLQSLATPELMFLTLPALLVEPAYRLDLGPEDLELLGLSAAPQRIDQDVHCLAIVTVQPDGRLTANLLAPVVINPKSRRAVQALQPGYSPQHPLPDGEAPCS